MLPFILQLRLVFNSGCPSRHRTYITCFRDKRPTIRRWGNIPTFFLIGEWDSKVTLVANHTISLVKQDSETSFWGRQRDSNS